LILGHEAAGVVVDGPLQGKRVTVNPLATCGKCRACKTGRNNLCAQPTDPVDGSASRRLCRAYCHSGGNLVEMPDDVSFEKACLAEPLACGWHGVGWVRAQVDVPWPSAVSGDRRWRHRSRCGPGAQGHWRCRHVTISEANPRRLPALKAAGDFTIVATPDEITAEARRL
jgi:hypothetical protein